MFFSGTNGILPSMAFAIVVLPLDNETGDAAFVALESFETEPTRCVGCSFVGHSAQST